MRCNERLAYWIAAFQVAVGLASHLVRLADVMPVAAISSKLLLMQPAVPLRSQAADRSMMLQMLIICRQEGASMASDVDCEDGADVDLDELVDSYSHLPAPASAASVALVFLLQDAPL